MKATVGKLGLIGLLGLLALSPFFVLGVVGSSAYNFSESFLNSAVTPMNNGYACMSSGSATFSSDANGLYATTANGGSGVSASLAVGYNLLNVTLMIQVEVTILPSSNPSNGFYMDIADLCTNTGANSYNANNEIVVYFYGGKWYFTLGIASGQPNGSPIVTGTFYTLTSVRNAYNGGTCSFYVNNVLIQSWSACGGSGLGYFDVRNTPPNGLTGSFGLRFTSLNVIGAYVPPSVSLPTVNNRVNGTIGYVGTPVSTKSGSGGLNQSDSGYGAGTYFYFAQVPSGNNVTGWVIDNVEVWVHTSCVGAWNGTVCRTGNQSQGTIELGVYRSLGVGIPSATNPLMLTQYATLVYAINSTGWTQAKEHVLNCSVFITSGYSFAWAVASSGNVSFYSAVVGGSLAEVAGVVMPPQISEWTGANIGNIALGALYHYYYQAISSGGFSGNGGGGACFFGCATSVPQGLQNVVVAVGFDPVTAGYVLTLMAVGLTNWLWFKAFGNKLVGLFVAGDSLLVLAIATKWGWLDPSYFVVMLVLIAGGIGAPKIIKML